MELPLRPAYPEELGIAREDASSCVSLCLGTPAPRYQPEDEDSADSAGEVEEPEENPPPSSSLPQTPEQEKYLKQHFETLADTDAGEKFDGSLKDLKPREPEDEEKNLSLNPRLSISARFLSRCQKNSRLVAAFPLRAQPRPQSPARAQEPLGDPPKTSEEIQQWEKPLDEEPWETEEETGSDSGKPMGSHLRVETFTAALRLLRTHFQETLRLYDQVTLCAEENFPQATTALADLFGWMKGELRSRAVTRDTDAATGTDSPAPPPPPDPETLALLRTYSDSLVEMVRRRLEGSSPETL